MKIIKPLVFNTFTLTRASEATYYNSSGVLVSAGVDEVREGYDPNTLVSIGTLLESAATNIVPSANDFTTWTSANSSTEVAIDALVLKPDGTGSAQSMSLDGPEIWTKQLNLGTISGARTFSIFVKPKSAGSGGLTSLTLTLQGGPGFSVFARFNTNFATPSVVYSGGVVTTSIQKINNGWLRVSISGVLPSSASPYFAYIYGDDNALSGADGNGLHHLWGAQVESGSSPTSFIYTSGSSATRAADIVTSQTPGLVSTNVAEDEAPEWATGVAYSVGEQVQVLGTHHRVYEALEASTDVFPPSDPLKWLDRGATNPWRMFDTQVGSDRQTESTDSSGSIEVTVAVEERVDTLVLFNVEGSQLVVTSRDGTGATLLEYTTNLLSLPPETGWWDFFFGRRTDTKVVVVSGLGIVRVGTIEVSLISDTGVAKIGKMVIGEEYEIGCTRFGSSVGIVDFSRKERDEFGNNYIVQRRYIDKVDYDIQLDTETVYEVREFLASVRSTPAVYIGSESGMYLATVVLGFYRDFSIILQGRTKSACTLQVEGI